MWKHPPGDEIYRKGNISVFEVDGKKNKVRERCTSLPDHPAVLGITAPPARTVSLIDPLFILWKFTKLSKANEQCIT